MGYEAWRLYTRSPEGKGEWTMRSRYWDDSAEV